LAYDRQLPLSSCNLAAEAMMGAAFSRTARFFFVVRLMAIYSPPVWLRGSQLRRRGATSATAKV
jgi:hypothetical protein